MTRAQFTMLAAAVILGGIAMVVSGVRLAQRLAPRRIAPFAGVLLLAYCTALILRPAAWPLINLAVLAGAAGGALLIERGLGTASSVGVFLIVAAVVDLLSTSGGITRALVERYRSGTSDFLLYLTLVVPIKGRFIPIVGIGDLLVGGAAGAALWRLGIRPLVMFGSIGVGLLAALGYGLWRGGAPALPFVACAVLLLLRFRSAKSAAPFRSS